MELFTKEAPQLSLGGDEALLDNSWPKKKERAHKLSESQLHCQTRVWD